MPSREDYLDDFLKGLSAEEEMTAAARESQASDMDSLGNLTEDEIDRILSAKTGGATEGEAHGDGDVLDLLDGDGNLQEIQDLLRKSDRNEAIQENVGNSESPADKLLADIEGTGERDMAEDIIDKKKQRAALKERRKEERAAKKAARKAAKSNGKKARKGDAISREGGAANASGEDGYFDRDVLDDIVSEAGRVRRQDGFSDRDDSLAAKMQVKEVDVEDAAGMVPDAESEFAALDIDEIDELIPDISEKKKGDQEEKKGFMSKAISFLLEEEEEEPENEDIRLSDENQQILDELDKEAIKDKSQKGKKKGKKKDKKSAKKKEAKPKKAKPPKKKKEAKPREEEALAPGKRLTFKKMLPVLLLGITVGAVLFIFVNIFSDYADKQVAKTAFSNEDYETCYLNLYGKKLNESEEAMYGKSESILYIRLWYQEYEIFVEEGLEAEALDSLIQTVNDYQALYEYAARWNAIPEVSEVYSNILNILWAKYDISEEQALEIAAVTSDIEYTRIVTALAEGRSYGAWGRPAVTQETENGESQSLQDALPEESGMEPGEFVENQ